MKEFIGMFKELYFGTIDMWQNDRKEFWEVYLGMALVVFVFWVSFYVVLPIVGN
jgi:hypothetical protein